MRLDINSEEFTNAKFKKYTSLATTCFMILSIFLTYNLIIKSALLGIWLLSLFISACSFCGFVYIMMKIESAKEPYIIINDDEMICNFKQVPTKQGSFKRRFIGSFESIKEDCNLNIVTHYELTNKHIIAYGYSNYNIRELTGFVIERFFDEDDEAIIIDWLKNHISNIHDPKLKYLLND